MKTIINKLLIITALVAWGNTVIGQGSPRVNQAEHCCNGTADFSAGRQGDCMGGNPVVELADTIPMFTPNGNVLVEPTYFPTGGSANWSSGQTSLTVSISPGTYNVVYTTSVNCTTEKSFVVTGYNNSISGSVFLDNNGDGTRAITETVNISNLTITLYDTEGNPVQESITDASGNYSFQGLTPKDYIVRIDSPTSNTVVTTTGLDNVFEPVSRATTPITVTNTSNIPNINAGLWPVPPGGISGRVWVDLDEDGMEDPDEPGIPGLPVFIFDFNGGNPDIYITDQHGIYDFRYLPPSGYFVQIFPPDDFPIVTIPFQGPSSTDSDFNPVPGGILVPPSAQTPFPIQINPPGQQVPDIDLGLKKDTVVKVIVKGILSGADRGNGEMGTELADGGLLPGTEPYSGLGYGLTEGTGLILNLSKVPNVVDYVVIELRDKNDSSVVVASKPGLMLKDGTVVDECGETMTFNVPSGTYYVALRHKNHLDVRTKDPVFLDDQDFTVDFSDPNTQTAGIEPAKPLDDGRLGLWGGDANGDNELKYSGPNNDRQKILVDIGGTDITNSTNGYKLEDINLDGVIKYSGPDNDRQILLENLGGTDVTATKKSGDK